MPGTRIQRFDIRGLPRNGQRAVDKVEVVVFDQNALQEARVVDNDPKDTKWAPNPT